MFEKGISLKGIYQYFLSPQHTTGMPTQDIKNYHQSLELQIHSLFYPLKFSQLCVETAKLLCLVKTKLLNIKTDQGHLIYHRRETVS